MSKSRLLPKVFPVGVTLGVLAFGNSMLVSPSAKAQEVCDQPLPGGGLTTLPLAPQTTVDVICVDKEFTNFAFFADVPIPPNAFYDVSVTSPDPSGTFFVDFDTAPGGGISIPFQAEASYMVEITDPDYLFNLIDLDIEIGLGTNGELPDITVTKEIFDEFGNLLLVLESEGDFVADSLPTMPDKILVVDTVDVDQGTFFSFQNSFTQKAVPEPASILGLLAIGSLGLGLKRKKQA